MTKIQHLFTEVLGGQQPAESLEHRVHKTKSEKNIKELKEAVDNLRKIIDTMPQMYEKASQRQGIAETMNAVYKGLHGRVNVKEEDLPTDVKGISIFMRTISGYLDQLAHDLRRNRDITE